MVQSKVNDGKRKYVTESVLERWKKLEQTMNDTKMFIDNNKLMMKNQNKINMINGVLLITK